MAGTSEATAERVARDQALAWFVRMNSGDATQADAARFSAWLGEDPRHRREYDRLGGIWSDLDALPDPRTVRSAPSRAGSRRQLLFGAAGIAGLAMVGAGLSLTGVTTALASDFQTATGERQTVTAGDGSRIDLDAGTAIAQEFTPDLRRFRLLEGRAMFAVKEEDRPLEVVCRDGTVRTGYGAFVMHRRAEDVVVAVESGNLSVTAVGVKGAPQRDIRLLAGQCVVYGAAGLGAVENRTGEAETAWQRGKLVFQDRPLEDVLADLSRYRPGRILVGDHALLKLRVDGIFDTSRPDAALDAIIQTLPVQVHRLTRYFVILRQA